MKTPAQYQHEIAELNDQVSKTTTAGENTKQSLQQLTAAEESLREIEHSLNLDIHALRAQFQGRATSISTQTQHRSGKARSEEEQRLENERQNKITPYEEIKKQIDELLAQLETTRTDLQKAKAG